MQGSLEFSLLSEVSLTAKIVPNPPNPNQLENKGTRGQLCYMESSHLWDKLFLISSKHASFWARCTAHLFGLVFALTA